MTDAPGDYPAARKDAAEALGLTAAPTKMERLWRGAAQYKPAPTGAVPKREVTMPSGKRVTLPRSSPYEVQLKTPIEQRIAQNQELDYYGLGEWSYRTANATDMLGPQNETLPEGAIGWDPLGKPYYGPGIAGIAKKYYHTLTGTPSWVKEGEKLNVIDRVRRAAGANLGLGFDVLGLFPQMFEQYFGLAQSLSESGEESPLPAVVPSAVPEELPADLQGDVPGLFEIAKMQGSVPGEHLDKWLFGTMWRATNVMRGLLNAAPPVMAYNYIRMITDPRSVQEKQDIYRRSRDASRIIYTQWVEPATRDEFVRHAIAGEDPELLAREFINPGAEFVGEIIFDPLNIVGFLGKSARTTRGIASVRDVLTKVPEPIDDAFRGLFRAAGDARSVEAIEALADAKMASSALRRVGLEKMSYSNGLFALNAHGKRAAIGEVAATTFQHIMANVENTDDALEILKGLALMASDDIDEVAHGVTLAASASSNARFGARPLFAQAGDELGILLREVMTVGGKFNPKAFLDELAEVGAKGNAEDILSLAQKSMEPTLDKMFPSIAERMAAGEDVGNLARNLAKFDASAQGVYRPINSFFANIYMGMNPGYAFRNWITNAFHIFVDEGPANMFNWKRYAAETEEWLKFVPAAAGRGLSPAAGAGVTASKKGLWSKINALGWSEKFEKQASHVVVGKAVNRTMRQMMKTGRAIPDVKPLVQAGLSDDAARMLVDLVVQNKGNYDSALKTMGKFVDEGQVPVWRFLSDWADPEDLKSLEKMGLIDGVENVLKQVDEAGGGVDDVLDGFRDIMRQWDEMAADVNLEKTATHASNIRFDDAVEMGGEEIDDAIKAGIHTKIDANQQSLSVTRQAIAQARQKADLFIQQNPEAAPMIEEIFKTYRGWLGDGPNTLVNSVGGANKEMQTIGNTVKKLVKGRSLDEIDVGAIWKQFNLPGEIPTFVDSKDLYETVYELMGMRRDRMWDFTRDHLFRGTRNFYDELAAAGIQLDERILNHARDNLRYAQSLERGALWMKGGRPFRFRVQGGEIIMGAGEGVTSGKHLLNIVKKYGPAEAREFTSYAQLDVEMANKAISLWRTKEYAAKVENIRPMFDDAYRKAVEAAESTKAGETLEASQAFIEQAFARMRGTQPPPQDLDRLGTTVHRYFYDSGFDREMRAAVRSVADQIGMREDDVVKHLLHEPEELLTVFQGRPAGFIKEAGTSQWWSESEDYAQRFAGEGGEVVSRNVPRSQWDQAMKDAVEASKVEGMPAPRETGLQGLLPDEEEVAKALDELEEFIPRYTEGTVPSMARVAEEQKEQVRLLVQRLVDNVENVRGRTKTIEIPNEVGKALDEWARLGREQFTEAQLIAANVATAARDFTLHNYQTKRNIDGVLGYIYPYHFWYNRTYQSWLKRIAINPEIVSAYAKYRRLLENIHAGAPDWWKYNINTNELLGLDSDNPLFFNLEATLNPLNGLTGVDFDDPDKRVGWFSSLLDGLGKFGPSTWTPFSIATAVALAAKGEDEAAAKWAGRLFPQSASIRAAAGLLGQDVEVDPFTHIFAGGVDPFERRRTGRALAALSNEGAVDVESALEAAYLQKGPIWDQAQLRAVQERAPGQLASFFLGVGFKGRSRSDMEIDRFYNDYYAMWQVEPMLSSEEFRDTYESLRQKYPFMDTLLLSRKGGVDRDRAFAYNVFARIPPAQTDDYEKLIGMPEGSVGRFYDDKGHIEDWVQTDRDRFMAGILDLSALLDVPDDATREEWLEAKNAYGRMNSNIASVYGDDIWDRVNNYYAAKEPVPGGGEEAEAILQGDPDIGAALDMKLSIIMSSPSMAAYYTSIEKIENYYKGMMYKKIEDELGEDIWKKWDYYHWLKDTSSPDARAYWRATPELGRYMDMKDELEPLVAQATIRVANLLPEGKGASIRDFEGELSQAAQAALPQIPGLMPNQQPTPEMWEKALGQELYRLMLDSEPLPEVAIRKLEKLGFW